MRKHLLSRLLLVLLFLASYFKHLSILIDKQHAVSKHILDANEAAEEHGASAPNVAQTGARGGAVRDV